MREYFSGANARLYLNGHLVDDMVTIEWSESNTKAPMYGYASTEYDAILDGQFIAQGRFTIAFRQAGYLNALLKDNSLDQAEATNSGSWARDTIDQLIKSSLKKFRDQLDRYSRRFWDDQAQLKSIPRPDQLEGGYSITVLYGAMPKLAEERKQPYTIRTLSGIHFTGRGQVIAPTGDPIAEYYTFIAREVDKAPASLPPQLNGNTQ